MTLIRKKIGEPRRLTADERGRGDGCARRLRRLPAWHRDYFVKAGVALAYTEGSMPGKVHRIIASFMLIWAIADMTVPGLCQADDNRVDPKDSLFVVTSQWNELPLCSSPGIPASDPDGSHDECFCCSPYASPNSVFNTHASANVASTPFAVLEIAAMVPLPIEAQLLTCAERRRLHSSWPDTLPSLLRC
jgi:hypothetical protein